MVPHYSRICICTFLFHHFLSFSGGSFFFHFYSLLLARAARFGLVAWLFCWAGGGWMDGWVRVCVYMMFMNGWNGLDFTLLGLG